MSIDQLCNSLDQVELLSTTTKNSPTTNINKLVNTEHGRFGTPSSNVWKPPPKPPTQIFHSFLCLDVESTCIGSSERALGNPHNLTDHQLNWLYPNEIVEWPVILLQWRINRGRWELYEVARYRSFVKPLWRPKVSEFCTQLTGITQPKIDNAPTLSMMLQDFQVNFVQPHRLFTNSNRSVWVTDGPWDLRDHWVKSVFLSKLSACQIPPYLKSPINMIDMRFLLRAFIPKVCCMSVPPSLSLNESLKTFGLEFEGQEHSGIDDAANLARLLTKLTEFDCHGYGPSQWIFRVNRTLYTEPGRYFWMGKQGKCTWTAP
ncbi:hypothetical protein CROQUDRAFT_657295 [Cronartium quercuum f. sp. fusiforme G11]|uniref:Exonuclease domain-containing protein n=1 Tax=Cronartium quercuum f. sp. fusiforme G11 TaxID=708437 RepID=A0A9P6NJ01_9BASI|nr:hypothetical protein CROQUDRAFT_657295 [Cronartium quercuum f. sp. fusiforme G11]